MNRKQTIKKSPNTQKDRRCFTRKLYAGNHCLFVAAIITGALVNSINLVLSVMMQKILDAASGVGDSLQSLGIGCAAIILGFLLIFEIFRRARAGFIRRAMTQYKEFVFGELTRKSIGTFSAENTSTYISALTNDTASIQSNYLENTFELLGQLISFFGSIALMLWYSPILTLVSILLSLLPMILSILTSGNLPALEQQVSTQNETFVGTIKDLLGGFSVIKSFKAEAQVQKLFCSENNQLESTKARRFLKAERIKMFSIAAMLISQLGIFLVAAHLAINGKITAGVVIVFVQLMAMILQPVGTLPKLIADRKAALALIDKISGALAQNTMDEEGKLRIPAKLSEGIRVNHLGFSYEENEAVLQNLNMEFRAGKSYAIVGNSGSGKSTLLNLLSGNSMQYDGEIYYDGNELRNIHTDTLYELLAIVQQNVFIFNDTIRNNVTMFKDFPEERIEEALRQSGLSALIAQKGGDYICGENGNALSGGEKQRISIARALLNNAPVLLMDEATAALDAVTAAAVMGSILDIEDLTRILVTHRLEETLLSRCDEILVMHGGQLAERGSFAELMKRQGVFYSLYMVAQ